MKRFFKRLFRAQNPSERDPGSDFWYGPIGAPTAVGISVTPEVSLQLTVVYDCLQVLSQPIASLPLKMFRRRPDGTKEPYDQHPVARLLRRAPNSYQTAYEFRGCMQWNLALYGNAYAEILPGELGPIGELVPHHPTLVRAERRDDGRVWYNVHDPRGGPVRPLRDDEIWHLRSLPLSADGIKGMAPWEVSPGAIGAAIAAQDYAARFFKNNGMSGGILEHPGFFKTPDQRDQFVRAWRQARTGTNVHRDAVLEHGIKYTAGTQLNNEQAQFIETRKELALDITRLWRIPPHKVGILDRATFCLPASEEVLTEHGPKSIADVAVGELVWSLGERGLELAAVKHSVCTGEDDLLEIHTTNRVLRANAKHRILVRRAVPDPRPGQGGYQCIRWIDEYAPAGELRVGDTLVAFDALPETGIDEVQDRRLSVGFMEFCGLLLGDGNVRKGWGVSIARGAAALYMDHYREIIKREFVSFGRHGNGRTREGVETVSVSLYEGERQTRFGSVLAAEELGRLEFCGTAHTKQVPGWVFKTTEELRLAFLRGYLDADGSVDKKGRIAYHSVNRTLLSQIRHLCMSVGVPVTNLRRQKVETRLPTGALYSGHIYTFTCSDPGKNARIGSHDPRYLARFAAGKPFHRKGRNYPRYGGRGFDVPGCALSRISEIRKLPPEPVYDLEVDGTHSFIANGVVVHNSNIEHQSIEFVQDTLLPWLVLWEQAISRDLIIADGTYFAEFNVAGLLRGDLKTRYDAYAVARQGGWLSVNDIRELENLNPIDGGDVYMSPLNMAPANKMPSTEQQASSRQPIVLSVPEREVHVHLPQRDEMTEVVERDARGLAKKIIKRAVA